MNFAEFKTTLRSVTYGDMNIPDDEALKNLVNLYTTQIALETKPMGLISCDITDNLLVNLDGKYFIREPYNIEDDKSFIDIDDSLVLGVVYQVASSYVSDKNRWKHIKKANTITSNYKWMRYKSSCDE